MRYQTRELEADPVAGNPSLASAVTVLFLEKKVKKDIGQFSSLLLLHGIYEEIKRVQSYLDRPLSSWVPSLWLHPGSSPAESGHGSSPPSDTKANLAVWRNAALDCVDVLHWAANGTIASAAGVEHPTVLHLHLSRVVLLVPYKSIQTLAKSISTLTAGRSTAWSRAEREEALRAEQEVVRWAQQDEVCLSRSKFLFRRQRPKLMLLQFSTKLDSLCFTAGASTGTFVVTAVVPSMSQYLYFLLL